MLTKVCGQDVSLPDMNDVEQVFNYVADHLLKQNKKSIGNEGIICLYRGEDNMCCAAGCLIPDEHYKQAYEGFGIKNVEFFNNSNYIILMLLHDLQAVHDSYGPDDWPRMLEEVRVKYLEEKNCLEWR